MSDSPETASLPKRLAAVDALSSLLSLNTSIETARAGMTDLFTLSANSVTEIAHEAGHDGSAAALMATPVDAGRYIASSAAATELKSSLLALTEQYSGR